jgi:hypothetical protein
VVLSRDYDVFRGTLLLISVVVLLSYDYLGTEKNERICSFRALHLSFELGCANNQVGSVVRLA